MSRNVQELLAPDGAPVAQEVLRREFVGITRGPLVYATGLIDGFNTEETCAGCGSPRRSRPRHARSGGRAPIVFEPYYRAGGRRDGAWRLTWFAPPPEEAA